jgi:hypothetical protein
MFRKRNLPNCAVASTPPSGPERELVADATQGVRARGQCRGSWGAGTSATAVARIVYTPAHIKLGRNTQVLVDLNHDGIADFRVFNNFSNFGNRISYRLFVSHYSMPTSFLGDLASKHPTPLSASARIGPKQHFSVAATSMAHFYTYSGRITHSSGPWKNVKNRYVGVQFRIKGETHYGWARLSVTMHRDGTYGISAVLTGYAYETVANRPIIAGKTKGDRREHG